MIFLNYFLQEVVTKISCSYESLTLLYCNLQYILLPQASGTVVTTRTCSSSSSKRWSETCRPWCDEQPPSSIKPCLTTTLQNYATISPSTTWRPIKLSTWKRFWNAAMVRPTWRAPSWGSSGKERSVIGRTICQKIFLGGLISGLIITSREPGWVLNEMYLQMGCRIVYGFCVILITYLI